MVYRGRTDKFLTNTEMDDVENYGTKVEDR